MKKLSLLMAAAAMSASAFALPSYVLFSSTGPDKYADGAEVEDGEVYALVWVAKDTSFKGINADGTLVDAVNNKIISAVPLATEAHCPPVIYMLTGENESLPEGSFSVYLLDTRVTAADGTKTVAGLTAEGALKAVNTATAVAASVAKGSQATAETAVAATSADVSAVPTTAPQPKITAVEVVGGKVIVQVADTVPYLQYGISAGKTPSKLDQNDLVQGVNGTAEGLTLIVDKPEENRFFKVIRK